MTPAAEASFESQAFGGFRVDSPRLRRIRRFSNGLSASLHVAALVFIYLWSTGILGGTPELIDVSIEDLQARKPKPISVPKEVKEIKQAKRMELSEVPQVIENPPPSTIPKELIKMPELADFDLGSDGPEGPAMIGKGGDIVAPKALTKLLPTYPENMRRLGREAKVKVRFTVHKDGTVSEVTQTSGPTEFGAPVIELLKKTAFSPATRKKDGRPIAVRLLLTFNFKLTGVPVSVEDYESE